MTRFDALQAIAPLVQDDDLVVVASFGGIKAEWYNLMPHNGTMFVHLMGGVIGFALGVAVALPHRRVFALDTDGGFLMNPGVLFTVGLKQPANLTIFVLDNEIYEAVGGFPTHTGGAVSLEQVASGAGIRKAATVGDKQSLVDTAQAMLGDGEPGFVTVKVQPGKTPLERIKVTDSLEDKYRFIRHIEQTEGIAVKPPFLPRYS